MKTNIFIAIATVLSGATGCMEVDGSNQSPPTAQTTISEMSNKELFSETYQLNNRNIEAILIEKCGSVVARGYNHIYDSSYQMRDIRKAQAELDVLIKDLPERKQCFVENLRHAISVRHDIGIRHQEVVNVAKNRLGDPNFEKSEEDTKYLRWATTLSTPEKYDLVAEVSEVERALEKADSEALFQARHLQKVSGQRQSRNAAILSAALSGAASSGAFSIKDDLNRANDAAGLPRILSPSEKAELQRAYQASLANSERRVAGQSGGRGEGIVLTGSCSFRGEFHRDYIGLDVLEKSGKTCESWKIEQRQHDKELSRAEAANQSYRAEYCAAPGNAWNKDFCGG